MRILRTQPVPIGLLVSEVGGVGYGRVDNAAQFVIKQLTELTAGRVGTKLRTSARRWQGPLVGIGIVNTVEVADKGLGAEPGDQATREEVCGCYGV